MEVNCISAGSLSRDCRVLEEFMKPEQDKSEGEAILYGAAWNVAHSGYFSDPKVSMPLVRAVSDAMQSQPPALVADLGGGTGYILETLLHEQDYPGVRFVNVDMSGDQTAACHNSRIETLNLDVASIQRSHFNLKDGHLMFIMRSVLHYFGQEGLRPLLKHLRAQMLRGEIFIHQTACFKRQADRVCFNHLYKLMKTHKWYPLSKELSKILDEEGFCIEYNCQAPALELKSLELGKRYHLSQQEITSIGKEIIHDFGETPGVFVLDHEGYTAFLHYEIFTCRAV